MSKSSRSHPISAILDSMQEPLYTPTQWVTYKHANGGGFGVIIGGDFDGKDWYYIIEGQLIERRAVRVKEDAILLMLDNKSWLPPLKQTSSDIYKDL